MAVFSRMLRGDPHRRDIDQGSGQVQCVGVVDGAIGGAERFASIAALFPEVRFEPIGADWAQGTDGRFDVVIVGVSAASPGELDAVIRILRARTFAAKVVVTLREADVTTTRMLVREGAADVLPAPVSEAGLALSLERLLSGGLAVAGAHRPAGRMVAMLKAGGGVGATALGVQAAALLAKDGAKVCVADLDLQFGNADIYFDLPEAVTVADCLSAGSNLADTPLATLLATHRSGARLLAAPRDVIALEAMGLAEVEALTAALRRDFSVIVLDLPAAWTAWTTHALNLADEIVLVTRLSVPHVQQVKRQLRALAAQGLGDRPLTIVCNGLSADKTLSVSVKAAERAIGRDFDVIIPDDERLMTAAINQGVELSAIRRGTKIEKAIGQLARRITQPAATVAQKLR